MSHLGFTGTQEGITQEQFDVLYALMRDFDWLHHGDCIGADASADGLANLLGLKKCIHPPTNPSKRAFCRDAHEWMPQKPYLDRNHDIVGHCELLVACPKEERGETLRSGTWATVRYARKIGRPVQIIRPSGMLAT